MLPSQVVELLRNLTMDVHIFGGTVKNLKDCEVLPCKGTKECIKGVSFRTVLMTDGRGNNDGHGTLYMKRFYELLQGQVKLCRREDIMLHLDRKERIFKVILQSITTVFFNRCYEEVSKKVM